MRSWLESANTPGCPFPLQNLPYGVAQIAGAAPVCVVAIGDMVLNLAALESAGLIAAGPQAVFDQPALNGFMALGRAAWADVRTALTDLLAEGENSALRSNAELQKKVLTPLHAARMHMPFTVAEYTDFYSGKQHAMNVGTMFRGKQNALPSNWLHIPIGYNGRASSVVVSGTDICRPMGQRIAPGADAPSFGPSQRMDIELEIGAVIGTGSGLGQPLSTAEADEMIFGYVLLNDWSSRDIQAWEYQPLGPFQGKAFGTSISPWVVTKAALEPFRCEVPAREKPLLPYLSEAKPGLYDIKLAVTMQPEGAAKATTICHTNYNRMYYSAAQQLTHHAIGGCPMNTGDLLGSGTISGPKNTEFGSLLELSWGGEKPFTLDTGETRSFIEDNDRLTLRGWAEGDGYIIGFGECTGRILPSVPAPEWTKQG